MSKITEEINNKNNLDNEVSCGELLAKTRQAKGLSEKDIAKELRINASVIEMIECNDFEAIGASVFVKGYLRQYANLLDLSEDLLLDSYNQINPDKNSAPIVNKAVESMSKHVLTPKLILMIIFSLLTLFLVWLLVSSVLKKEPAVNQVTSIENIEAASIEPMLNEVSFAETEEIIIEKSESIIDQDLAPEMEEVELIDIEETLLEKSESIIDQDLAPEMEEVELIDIEETVTEISELLYLEPEGLTLAIEYSGLCWTEIYDVNGKLLFYDLGDLNRNVIVSGTGPLDVLFGAATEVLSLSVDDQSYPLPRTSRQDEVLRFKVSKL
jgi:cytoskeleton protein RodZ